MLYLRMHITYEGVTSHMNESVMYEEKSWRMNLMWHVDQSRLIGWLAVWNLNCVSTSGQSLVTSDFSHLLYSRLITSNLRLSSLVLTQITCTHADARLLSRVLTSNHLYSRRRKEITARQRRLGIWRRGRCVRHQWAQRNVWWGW